jgi:hypothetical protein
MTDDLGRMGRELMTTTKKRSRVWVRGVATFGLLALVVLALTGCFRAEEIEAISPTDTPNAPQPTRTPRPTATPKPQAAIFPLPAPAHVTIDHPAHQTCIGCHTDAERLKGSISIEEATAPGYGGHAWAVVELPSVERWRLVYLYDSAFLDTVHGRYGCITCHGGTGDTLLVEVAHMGLVAEPSAAGLCGDCHAKEVSTAANSLHSSLAGYRTVLMARMDPDKTALLDTVIGNHCAPCHAATCGQCHVSRAAPLGGGLVASHLFEHTPPIDLTCAGCHDSRIYDEYRGQGQMAGGDVHWIQGEMLCIECHELTDFHGTDQERPHRYDGPPNPDCQSSGCHREVAEGDGIAQHGDSHLTNLSCQACHAAAYQNCFGCHLHMEDGVPQYTLASTRVAFKIGRNPLQDRYRPWNYVPVRHVPVARDSFAYYGQDLMAQFDALPTWKYATPHTIQRITPQNRSCNACHGNANVFLTAADVAADELNANRRVIVEQVPKPVE